MRPRTECGRRLFYNALIETSNIERKKMSPRTSRIAHIAFAAAVIAAASAPQVAAAREFVHYHSELTPGSIVVSEHERKLYLIVDHDDAIAYKVAVPKAGKEWTGVVQVNAKYVAPDWTPPEDVKHDHPELPEVIPGGAPNNPMGARAMTLSEGQVAIHGTTDKMRKSIGSAASYGCIRMLNEDIVDLYDRVPVGATVVMTP
ncbi:L,D-transpeptidase [Methylocystis sp. 9N]|uniref:L,D-transpeptidase n=1 Tax=Methylocystis borbori TaxID=3118750 RepID=A0ABU7XIG4_9HYPH